MMLPLLLLLASGPSAVDAERAFAAHAQAVPQWRAFADYAAEEAVMFVPQQVNAHEWLPKQPEPKIAVQWWPAESYASCDGGYAVNTGPWALTPPRLNGFFTTVWRRGAGEWKWIYDGGAPLARPRAAGDGARVRKASCRGTPNTVPAVRYRDGQTGEGQSEDRTLAWRWHVAPDGARSFDAWAWNGRTMRAVVTDRIASAP